MCWQKKENALEQRRGDRVALPKELFVELGTERNWDWLSHKSNCAHFTSNILRSR